MSIMLLSACDAWSIQPLPIKTSIPSSTPIILSATPIVITLPFTSTPGVSLTITSTSTSTDMPSPSNTPTQISIPPTATPAPVKSLQVQILGCSTSIDIIHGMGEVTNAFIIVKNTSEVDLPNTCALLRANDENRQHPDKTRCVANLPAQNQVTLKLTVDSAYKQDTAIQVDVSSNDILLFRTDKSSCSKIDLFGGDPSNLNTIKPIQP
jgi:hypothetical protein